mgnify:CR=1 FL=1
MKEYKIKKINTKVKEVEIRVNPQNVSNVIESKAGKLVNDYLTLKKNYDANIKKVIEQRLEILNRFIVSNISGVNMEKCVADLKLFLNNNSDFMKTTRLSFEVTHPKFISFLVKKDKTREKNGKIFKKILPFLFTFCHVYAIIK